MASLKNFISKINPLDLGISLSLLVLVTVISYSYFSTQRLYSDFKWVQHTYEVQNKLASITNLVSESESAKRGFLITNQKEFLYNYYGFKTQITDEINLLQELKQNDSIQSDKIIQLENLILHRLSTIDSLINLKLSDEEGYLSKHVTIINLGTDFMHKIRKLNLEIIEREAKLLKQRESKAYNDLSDSNKSIFFAGFLSLLIILLVVFFYKKDIDKQNKISKDLRELDAQKNKFFSIISHDLRNPVNAVKQLSGFLKSDNLTEGEVRTIGKMIEESILKVSNLLEDLLKWGKLQMNKIEFKMEVFNIDLLIYECVASLHQNSFLKNISVQNEVAPNIAVLADKNMVLTVVRNLLSNSIKFTHKGGVIEIMADYAGNFVNIKIKDNGIGMSPETLSNLFRIDSTHSLPGTEKEIGTGLGLILCKEFVEKNGGKIEVQSVPNKGTTISFTLPRP
jgi:signal transduction histidine kinase